MGRIALGIGSRTCADLRNFPELAGPAAGFFFLAALRWLRASRSAGTLFVCFRLRRRLPCAAAWCRFLLARASFASALAIESASQSSCRTRPGDLLLLVHSRRTRVTRDLVQRTLGQHRVIELVDIIARLHVGVAMLDEQPLGTFVAGLARLDVESTNCPSTSGHRGGT